MVYYNVKNDLVIINYIRNKKGGYIMYYGNSYGYGQTGCCPQTMPYYYYGGGTGNGYAIILVLFILLIIIIGARNWV